MMATDAQWSYVKRLMNEAFSKLYKDTPNIDVHHMPRNYTKDQADADIKRLLEAKSRGWKPAVSEQPEKKAEVR